MNRPLILIVGGVLATWLPAVAQDAGTAPAGERWSIHFQATSIGQEHGSFRSPYEGANSLPPHPEKRVSLTATVFLAYRLNSWTEVVFNPEEAGGEGFGNVTGIAGFTNGEMPRVASATPTLYVARGYIQNTWALGGETEALEGGPNQLAGKTPVRRFTLITGKFSLMDFFNTNKYSDDPRIQFMNWSLMYNGAWDYPADVRGYTVGSIQELTMRTWSLRAATTVMSTVANGPTLDTRLAKNRGQVVEWDHRHSPFGHAGVFRVLGFLNRERAGTYRLAPIVDGVPDLDPTRRPGTKKYGFTLDMEQEIAPNVGVFGRYGWSDGKTEAWEFTEIDRTLSGGLSIQGKAWRRSRDTIGIAGARNYLGGDQRCFLAAGGLGFSIGDGRLNYAPESTVESYYALGVTRQWTVTLDYQHVANPAYNRDRGPVSVASLRLHWER